MIKKILMVLGIVLGAIVTTIIAFVCFVILVNNILSENLSKNEIYSLVNENYNVILEDISENNYFDTKAIKGVKEVYSDTEVIEVYCGGSGMGSATNYYGFYYSPDNQPKTTWCGTDFGDVSSLNIDGNGFSIKYSNDDNCYYTEKIRDNFYYYEAHF